MGRRARFHRDRREQAYRTEAGGCTRYFREIARDDHAGIALAFAAHLGDLEAKARPPEPDVLDLCLAFVKAERGVDARTVASHKGRLLKFCAFPAPDHPDCLGGRKAKDLKAADLKKVLASWEAAGYSDHYRFKIRDRLFAQIRRPSRRKSRLVDDSNMRGPCVWGRDFDPAKRTITLPPDRHGTGRKTMQAPTSFLPPAIVRAPARAQKRVGRHPMAMFTHQRTGRSGLDATMTGGEPWGESVARNGRPSFVDDSTPLTQVIRKIRIAAIADQEARRAAAPARGVPADLAPKVTIADKGDNRFVFYRLRHTVASDFLMKGGVSATVATLLGTSSRVLETTYGHLLEEHLADAAEKLRARPARPKGPTP